MPDFLQRTLGQTWSWSQSPRRRIHAFSSVTGTVWSASARRVVSDAAPRAGGFSSTSSSGRPVRHRAARGLVRRLTVRPHGTPCSVTTAGLFVAWRGDGVHVSAAGFPFDADIPRIPGCTRDSTILQTPEFWSAYARSIDRSADRSERRTTTSTWTPDAGCGGADRGRRRAPRCAQSVSAHEWEESGFDGRRPRSWSSAFPPMGVLVAAANLHVVRRQHLATSGVLVAPDARGPRLVDRVGRAAASYAVSRARPRPLACPHHQPRLARCRPPARLRAVVHPARDPLTPRLVPRGWRASSSGGWPRTPRCRRRGRA